MEIFIFSILSVFVGIAIGIIVSKKLTPNAEKSEIYLRLETEYNVLLKQFQELKLERNQLKEEHIELITEISRDSKSFANKNKKL